MVDEKKRHTIFLELRDNDDGTVDIILSGKDMDCDQMSLLNGQDRSWTPAQKLGAQLYSQLCINNLQPPDPEGTA